MKIKSWMKWKLRYNVAFCGLGQGSNGCNAYSTYCFVILEEFNDLVEDKPSFFLVLSKVILELKHLEP